MVGSVKWFNQEKGFGFILDEEGTEYFVHYSYILKDGYKSLEEGKKVEFEISKEEKGLQAKNVIEI